MKKTRVTLTVILFSGMIAGANELSIESLKSGSFNTASSQIQVVEEGKISIEKDSLLNKIISLSYEGQMEEAFKLAEKFPLLSEKERVANPVFPGELRIQAVAYRETGDFFRAEKTYQLAVKLADRAFGRDSIQSAALMNDLGWVYMDQRSYAAAFGVFENALTIARANHDLKNDKESAGILISALTNLAKFYKYPFVINQKSVEPQIKLRIEGILKEAFSFSIGYYRENDNISRSIETDLMLLETPGLKPICESTKEYVTKKPADCTGFCVRDCCVFCKPVPNLCQEFPMPPSCYCNCLTCG